MGVPEGPSEGHRPSEGQLSAAGRSVRLLGLDGSSLANATSAITDEAAQGTKRAFFSYGQRILGTSVGHWTILILMGFCLLSSGALCWSLSGGNEDFDTSLNDSCWISWTLFFDPGTQTSLKPTDSWRARSTAVAFSIFGFIFNLTLLGMMVEGIRASLQYLKDLYGKVSASGHVLILGWGDKTLFLLNELLAAEKEKDDRSGRSTWFSCFYRGRRRRQIVILANRSVVDMMNEVRMHLCFYGMSHRGISYREGDPSDRVELMKVSANEAGDILVLSAGQGGRLADQGVIQTLLALAALPGNTTLNGSVVAEMQSDESTIVVRTVLPAAEGIVARFAVNRVVVLRTLVPSVGFCFLDMLSITNGSELYLRPAPPAVVGKTIAIAQHCYPEAVVCGVRSRMPGEESLCICDAFRVIVPEDTVILITNCKKSADNCVAKYASKFETRATPQDAVKPVQALHQPDGQLLLGNSGDPKNVCMIGCPGDFPHILSCMDKYLATGSQVHILSPMSMEFRTEQLRRYMGPLENYPEKGYFERIEVTHHIRPTTTCSWDIKELPLATADSALILSEYSSAEETASDADARSITSAITLKSIMDETVKKEGKKRGGKKCKVVTELLDAKSQQVLDRNGNVRKTGSFVYSCALETGVFALAVEEKEAYNVLMELFNPVGERSVHITAVPTKSYVCGTEMLCFFDIHDRVAQACGGILIGWRRTSERYPELNPKDKELDYEWSDAVPDEFLILRSSDLHTSRKENPKLEPSQIPHNSAMDVCLPPGCVTLPVESCVTLPVEKTST
mmetsp:Transcript_35600/g.80474  ORF Transcript_35600/g.80474 Transcript_35600/m.80474 type:complete len:794 (-) Transcript_35600:101-2482(-)